MADVGTRSTTELLMDVADDVRLLVRKEIELARIEVVDGLRSMLLGTGVLLLAAFASLPGLLFLVIALALWLPFSAQVGFAIVGAGLLAFTGGGIAIGVALVKRRKPGISKTVDAVKEDVRWAREQIKP